jgi:hypothetical protein
MSECWREANDRFSIAAFVKHVEFGIPAYPHEARASLRGWRAAAS